MKNDKVEKNLTTPRPNLSSTLFIDSNLGVLLHKIKTKIYLHLFFITLLLQIVFWNYSKNVRPEFNLLPNPIDSKFSKLASLGDDEFLFRSLIIRIQNAGDIYAGFEPLRNYDYQKLYDWFIFLDSLNAKSRLTPSLAAYTYSNIDDVEKTQHLINYLQYRGQTSIDDNWWWIFQAIYLARKIDDRQRALHLAQILASNKDPEAPLWTKQMSAFIYAKYDEGCLAFFAIKNVIDDLNRKNVGISVDDMNFYRYFINTRLKRLKNDKFNPNDCK